MEEMVITVEVVDKEKKIESKEGSSSMVRWENFVPRSGIRVLLIEADDSTRQIIGALLRKCSYKVATAPDGLKAWEVLKARPHHIDLILTEMELPSISGYALLSLIMEHEICKNIPVIMMSKYDSFSMVYKCMTKGAADFLVKPIRINELKNLWQHVWRRQSASKDLGPRDGSVALDTLEATAENNATSDRSSGSKACAAMQEGCCKKGSDAESSCGKLNLEAETAYMNETEVYSQPKQELSPVTEASIQERVICGNSAPNLSTPESGAADTATYKGNRALDRQERLERQSQVENVNMCTQASGNKKDVTYSPREAIDLIGAFDNNSKRHICPNDGANRHDSSPHLDLSLTRCPLVETETKNGSENQMLSRSNTSAFTRYINKAVQHGSDTKADCDSTPRNNKIHSGDNNPPPPPESNSSAKDSDSMRQYGPKVHSVPLNRTVETEQGSGNVSQKLFPIPLSMGGVRVDGSSPSPCSANPQMNSYNQFGPRISSSEPGCGQEHNRLPLEDQSRFLATNQCTTSYVCDGRESGNEGSHVSHDLSRQRSFQREAALNKFRLKRKERCFEKKVRYESRKKLAEQRPRVKGQFVRQVPPDPPPKSDNSGGNSNAN